MDLNLNYRDLFIGLDTPVILKNGLPVIPINFDNGATTPPLKSVVESIMNNVLTYGPVARGTGQKGDLCTEKFEESRYKILEFFNLKDTTTHTVVYTKGTTESLNLLANVLIKSKDDKILTTRMEHHANDLPWRNAATVEYVEVDELGRINIQTIEDKLIQNKGEIKYVSITGSSNVTGYINPIHDIAKLCHDHGAKIIVDAAQLVAHKKTDMKGKDPSEQIDFLVFSAHKAYAPFGSGAIVGLTEDLSNVEPFLRGGGCVDTVSDSNVIWEEPPCLHEAGTQNFLGVMGMVSALEQLEKITFDNIYKHEMEIKNYIISEMKQIKNVILYGDTDSTDDRLGVITFNIEGIPFDILAHKFADDLGIALRCGKFCAHPYVNRLLGVSDMNAYVDSVDTDLNNFGMVRLSLGLYNTIEEATVFITALQYIAKGL